MGFSSPTPPAGRHDPSTWNPSTTSRRGAAIVHPAGGHGVLVAGGSTRPGVQDVIRRENREPTLGKSSIMDASSTRAETVTRSLMPPISARKPVGWNHQFFIRVDLNEVFHTYPELGGPFRSIEEAEEAMLRRLDELWDPKMGKNDGLLRSEIAIRDALHWPDGTKKYTLRSNPDSDHVGLVIQALLDKYNEENVLSGDDAYHLEDILRFQELYEGGRASYYHMNCTRKTKGGVDSLFFAEVLRMVGVQSDDFELNCLHMIQPAVDNGPCSGCADGSVGMKHPTDAGKYKGGHHPSWPQYCCGGSELEPQDIDAMIKAREERIISQYKTLDVVKSDAGRTGTRIFYSAFRAQLLSQPFTLFGI